jgi:predicted transcriptional regulator
MSDTAAVLQPTIIRLVAQIVAQYVTGNSIPPAELPGTIASVYGAFTACGHAEASPVRPGPKVSVKKSVHPDYLVCLEDGTKLKMLKRHLKTHHDLTPEQYREKWGLPTTYPMVAPNYAARRSSLAKAFGLGRTRAPTAETPTKPQGGRTEKRARKSGKSRRTAA